LNVLSPGIRRIGRLVVEFEFPQGVPEEARDTLEKTALACPVKLSLHPDIELEMNFAWG